MLPQDRHQHEDRGDKDDGKSDLADRSTGERFDFALRPFTIFFFVPARERSEQQQADKGKNNSDDTTI